MKLMHLSFRSLFRSLMKALALGFPRIAHLVRRRQSKPTTSEITELRNRWRKFRQVPLEAIDPLPAKRAFQQSPDQKNYPSLPLFREANLIIAS